MAVSERFEKSRKQRMMGALRTQVRAENIHSSHLSTVLIFFPPAVLISLDINTPLNPSKVGIFPGKFNGQWDWKGETIGIQLVVQVMGDGMGIKGKFYFKKALLGILWPTKLRWNYYL